MQSATQPQHLDMLNGPIWNKLPRYALPVAATGILGQLFNAADIAVVGNFTGDMRTAAVAAVGANSPVIGLLLNLFIGITLGANVVIANAIGRGDRETVHRAVHTSIVTALIGGVLVAVFGQFIAAGLMGLLNVPDDVYPLALAYLRAKSGGIVEEYIQQHPTLAQLNPGAVSIVRFYTVTAPSGTYLFAPVLTTAIEKDISNGCQDALTAMIDIRTGVVLTDAVDQNNFIDYHTHPVTGVPFPGLQLPFWEETIDMMRRAVPLASKISNIGWDVTMTADGPLIIEANTIPGFNTAQYRGYAWVTDGYGYQPLFDELNGRPFVNNDHYARVLLKLD